MKEKLYNIPINDAVNAGDECPFCYIERKIEQDMMDFVLGSGSTYMESDVRDATDKAGFCREHYRKMFQYGNTLGNAWIMKTYLQHTIEDAEKSFGAYKTTPNGFKAIIGKKGREDSAKNNSITEWVNKRSRSCYICNEFSNHYDRYMKTFFEMYDKDVEFAEKVRNSRCFCLPHFSDLLDYAVRCIPENKQQEFADTFIPLMKEQLNKLYGDVSWLIEKFDYQNKDADWKDSKDALQRAMQKLKGGYPADPEYRAKK